MEQFKRLLNKFRTNLEDKGFTEQEGQHKYPFDPEAYIPYANPHLVGILGTHPQNLNDSQIKDNLNTYYQKLLNTNIDKEKELAKGSIKSNDDILRNAGFKSERNVNADIANAYGSDIGKSTDPVELAKFFREESKVGPSIGEKFLKGLDESQPSLEKDVNPTDTTTFNKNTFYDTKGRQEGGSFNKNTRNVNLYNSPNDKIGTLFHELLGHGTEPKSFEPENESTPIASQTSNLFDTLKSMNTIKHHPSDLESNRPIPNYMMKPFQDEQNLPHTNYPPMYSPKGPPIDTDIYKHIQSRDKLEQPIEDQSALSEEDLKRLLNIQEKNSSPDDLAKPQFNFGKVFNQIQKPIPQQVIQKKEIPEFKPLQEDDGFALDPRFQNK